MTRSTEAFLRIATALTIATLIGGCTADEGPRTVTSRFINSKIPAIRTAVQDRDLSVAPALVGDLDSEDPAIRFYAIQGLRRLTGEDYGYVYYADASVRRPAMMKWRQWLADQDK